MDLWFVFEDVPLLLGSLFTLVIAIFLLNQKDAKGFVHILMVVFIIAAMGAISFGWTNSTLHSPPWTLQMYEIILLLIVVATGIRLALSTSSILIMALIYFLFLNSFNFISNVLIATVWILVWIIFLRGTILSLKAWFTHPDKPPQ